MGKRVLEVKQLWGDVHVDTRHCLPGDEPVRIGASFDIAATRRTDFYVPAEHLPEGVVVTFVEHRDGAPIALVMKAWNATLLVGTTQRPLSADTAGVADAGDAWEVAISPNRTLTLRFGDVALVARWVERSVRTPRAGWADVEPDLAGIGAFSAFLGILFGIVVYLTPPDARHELLEIPDRFVQRLLVERPGEHPSGPKRSDHSGSTRRTDERAERASHRKDPGRSASETDGEVASTAGIFSDGSIEPAAGVDLGIAREIGAARGGWVPFGTGGYAGWPGPTCDGPQGCGPGGSPVEGMGVMTRIRGGGPGTDGLGERPEAEFEDEVPPPTIIGEGLPKSVIDDEVKRNLAAIRYCYQRELQQHPNLSGKVVIQFVVALDGTVSRARAVERMGNPSVERCIEDRFLRMHFPKPDRSVVVVKYPFVFRAM